MKKFLHIAGTPKTTIVVLADDGVVHSLTNPADPALVWGKSVSGGVPAGYSSLAIAGTPPVTTLALPHSLQFLTLLGSHKAGWKHVQPPLPANLALSGVAGDAPANFVLVAAGGKALYHVSDDGKDWQQASTSLPFDIARIAGDTKGGVLLVSDQDPSQLAHSGADWFTWIKFKDAGPIKIELVTGDIAKGFVVFGEGQLYTLSVTQEAPAWTPLPTPDFAFTALSGNPVDGVAALIRDSSGASSLVAYATDPAHGPWCLALVAPAAGEAAAA